MPTSNPAVLQSLMPGANMGGSSVAIPPVPGSTMGSPSIGGNTNPFIPMVPSGQQMPGSTNSLAMPANTEGATPADTGMTGQDLAGNLAGSSNVPTGWNAVYHDLKKRYGAGMGGLLMQFLKSGAGFNPEAMKALFASMGPQIERGQESIMEQFSAMGNRFGSPAAVGIGDYMSQVNLNMEQIMAQMYEQSIQDYMSVLTGKSTQNTGNRFMNAFLPALGQGTAALLTG